MSSYWTNHSQVWINRRRISSPAQFAAGGVSVMVAAALAETGLEPQRLELGVDGAS